MILLLKVNQMFLKCLFFLIIRLKYFRDSLNIVVTLALGAGEPFFDTLREKRPNMEFFPAFGLNTP